MNFKTTTLLCAAVILSGITPVSAQDAVNADEFLREQGGSASAATQQTEAQRAPSELEKGIAEAKAELEDEKKLQKKVELAKEMHDIRPTRQQVDAAVARASMGLPPRDRPNFVNAMKGMLNYNAIERISVDAMVETYTLKELESMVEYYSKPEAKSASDKVMYYAGLVQPEIVNMIDKAMMRYRTGQ